MRYVVKERHVHIGGDTCDECEPKPNKPPWKPEDLFKEPPEEEERAYE